MSSRCYIVDQSDTVQYLKERNEITSTDIYRVTALWIENSKGEVLIAQRGLTKKNGPWLWGPAVAGTVEEWEDYDINMYKEAQEEIGLSGYTFQKELKEFMVTPNHRYFCQWYSLRADISLESFVVNWPEVEAIEWIKKETLFNKAKANPQKYTRSITESTFVHP